MLTATALHLRPQPLEQDQIALPIPPAPPVLPVVVEQGDSDELRQRAARFAQAVAEVLHGHRPARQLGPWLAADVYDQLLLHLRGRRAAPSRHRVRVASVHVEMIHRRAAEIAVRLVHGGRSTALALRLDLDSDAPHGPIWRCTALTWA